MSSLSQSVSSGDEMLKISVRTWRALECFWILSILYVESLTTLHSFQTRCCQFSLSFPSSLFTFTHASSSHSNLNKNISETFLWNLLNRGKKKGRKMKIHISILDLYPIEVEREKTRKKILNIRDEHNKVEFQIFII